MESWKNKGNGKEKMKKLVTIELLPILIWIDINTDSAYLIESFIAVLCGGALFMNILWWGKVWKS